MSLDERLRDLRRTGGTPDAAAALLRFRERARKSRMHRMLGTSLLVLGLIAGGIGAGTYLTRITKPSFVRPSVGEPGPLSSGWRTYVDPERGWSIEYPDGWHVQKDYGDDFEDAHRGVLISNLDRDLQHPDLGPNSRTSAWDFRGTPTDVVVVNFGYDGTGPRSTNEPDTRLPLSFDDLKETPVPTDSSYGAPTPLFKRVIHNADSKYSVRVWIGDEATDAQREAAKRMVESIAYRDSAPGNYYDTEFRWSLRYPTNWHAQPFNMLSRIWVRGVVLSNVDHEFTHPGGATAGTTAWDFTDAPDNLVAVQFQHSAGGPAPRATPPPDTDFPLTIDGTAPSAPTRGAGTYAAPPAIVIPVTAHGESGFSVLVWFGPKASEEDKRLASEIVASIRFDSIADPVSP
ncbi:MAG: hypothetical protein WDA27_06885 [Actinomycetota bacterium]